MVSGVRPDACGKLALVIVQVPPGAVSVQAVTAVMPAASEDILAPPITVVPSASLVTLIVAESKSLRATFVSVAV